MDFNGLVIETNSLNAEEVFDFDGSNGAIDFGLDIKIVDNLVASKIDIIYFRSKSVLVPLVTLKTTQKFWVDQNNLDVEMSERFLFSIKTQNNYMFFMLYQKLTSLKIENVSIIAPPDKVFYDLINKQLTLAELKFNEQGNYSFPF